MPEYIVDIDLHYDDIDGEPLDCDEDRVAVTAENELDARTVAVLISSNWSLPDRRRKLKFPSRVKVSAIRSLEREDLEGMEKPTPARPRYGPGGIADYRFVRMRREGPGNA
jgi:hypothetical protein